ncbi:MAG: hypothetical protein HY682_10425 [Chloroflexi bacterium]|nr:hypothetical protein [Chloroflexota bacterium]
MVIFIRSFRHHAVNMKVPRAITTQHPLGRTVGAPFDAGRQRDVVSAALGLLDSARANCTILDWPEPYRIV